MQKIVLASKSLRRRQLLSTIIKDFEIVSPCATEIDAGIPEIIVLRNAQQKAYNILENEVNRNKIIISCDTIVTKGNKIYGKPINKEHAKSILFDLQGEWHRVISGVFIHANKEYYYCVESAVLIKNLPLNKIDEYIERYAPYDKAGSYGIQDKMIVEKYKGDYNNIVGLPLRQLQKILRENNIDVQE